MSYEEKSLAADKELAELLGWTNLKETEFKSPHDYLGVSSKGLEEYITRWTQDDASSFQLMVEHDITVEVFHKQIWATDSYVNDVTDCFAVSYFPSKAAAVRFAIVQAVINKLKEPK